MCRFVRGCAGVWIAAAIVVAEMTPAQAGVVTREDVERAIQEGVRYLKKEQRDDGAWPDADHRAQTGTTSLVTLALLTAGEKPNSPAIAKALGYLRANNDLS